MQSPQTVSECCSSSHLTVTSWVNRAVPGTVRADYLTLSTADLLIVLLVCVCVCTVLSGCAAVLQTAVMQYLFSTPVLLYTAVVLTLLSGAARGM